MPVGVPEAPSTVAVKVSVSPMWMAVEAERLMVGVTGPEAVPPAAMTASMFCLKAISWTP